MEEIKKKKKKKKASTDLAAYRMVIGQKAKRCRNKGYPSSLKIYLAKVASIYQIENTIAESIGKRIFHDVKWKKFVSHNSIPSGSC